MALASQRSLFIHIPKTAGTWIRHVYRACNIQSYEVGLEHTHFPELGRIAGNELDKFLYAFVRHPLTWYQSRWAFRMLHGWQMNHPLDYHCASNDFCDFVSRVLDKYPGGWVTHEYASFIDRAPRPLDFVGLSERAKDDLIKALTMAGEKFNISDVERTSRINESLIDGKPSWYWARYTPQVLERVLAVEHAVISKYYDGFKINMNKLL